MKRFLALLLVLMLLVVALTGCDPKKPVVSSSVPASSSQEESSSDTIDVSSEEESSSEPIYEEPSESYDNSIAEPSEEDPYAHLSKEQRRARLIGEGADEELLKAAMTHEFDTKNNFIAQNSIRVANAIRKAQRGETVTIGFIGGQNTTLGGDMVSSTYLAVVRDWWITTFPGKVNIVNAGHYTMSSTVATYRLRHDLLQYEPDLVFVDFAVQDAFASYKGAKANSIPFENIVRRVLESSKKPGVVVLMLGGAENTSYVMKPGNCDPIATSKYHMQIADYYKLPVIDFNNAVWDTIFTLVDKRTYGEIPLLSWDTFAQYNIAFNEVGHRTLGNMITYYLNTVTKKLGSIPTTAPALPSTYRFGSSEYMKNDMISPNQIVDKKAPGFDIDKSLEELGEAGYVYRNDPSSPASQCIIAYRPTEFINLTLPEVTKANSTFFLLSTSETVKADLSYDYSPVQFNFFNKDGVQFKSSKPVASNLEEAIKSWRVAAVEIPVGTTRIEYKVYVTGGTVSFLGFAFNAPPVGIIK